MPRRPPETKVELVALGVAEGLSLNAAAKKAGVPESTARLWTADPGFDGRVARFRRAIIGRTLGILASASNKAALTLIKLLDDPDSEIRLKAGRAVFGDLVTLDDHFSPGRGGSPDAPGLVVPGLDARWQGVGGEGGAPCETPTG